MNNIINDTQCVEIGKTNNKNITIDMNGYEIQSNLSKASNDQNAVFKLHSSSTLTLTNSKAVATVDGNVDQPYGNDSNGAYITYKDENGNLKKAQNIGLIHTSTSGKACVDLYHGSKLIVEYGVGFVSDNGIGIRASQSGVSIELNESYVCHNHQSGIVLEGGPTLTLNNGAVVSLNDTPGGNAGGGIYAASSRGDLQKSRVILNDGCLVSYNTAAMGGGICIGDNSEGVGKTLDFGSELIMYGGTIAGNVATQREGGGIALRYKTSAKGALYGGVIRDNKVLNDLKENNQDLRQWGGGGVFASEGSYLWMPDGADIYENTSDGLGGGLTGCSTGKIILDPSLNIFNNTAHGTTFTSGSEKQKDLERVGDNQSSSNPYRQGEWQGKDIFGAETTQITTGENSQYKGIADGTQVETNGSTVIHTDDWLVLTNMNTAGSGVTHKLQIYGNTSTTHGAGVLINGWLVVGNSDHIYVGDDVGLTATKALVNGAGETLTSDQTFRFKVTDSLDENAKVLATGTVNGSGTIEFGNRLTLQPENDAANISLTCYFMEDAEGAGSTILPDQTVYRLVFNLTQSESTTISMPVWDEEYEAYKSKSITVYEYALKTAAVSRRTPGAEDFVDTKTHEFSGSGIKELKFAELFGSTATFTNTKIDKKEVEVVKKWADGNGNHTSDTVNVYLKVRKANDSEGSEQIIEAVTLNSDSFKGGNVHLPEGVTGEATEDWNYSWKDLPLEKGGQDLIYSVSEECSNLMYGGTIEQSSTNRSEKVTSDTTAVEAWVPAKTLVEGHSYVIVDPNSGNALDLKSYKNNDNYWVTERDKKQLTSLENNEDIRAYTINQSLKTLTYETRGSKKGLVARPSSGNEAWLALLDSRYDILLAVQGSSFDSNILTSLQVDEQGRIQMFSGNNQYTVVFNDNTFGLGSSNSNPAKLYEQGTVHINQKSEVLQYIQTETFTITNTKLENLKFGLDLTKTDQDEKDKTLSGAYFTLTKNGEQQPLKFTKDGSKFVPTADGSGSDRIATDENGKLVIRNLEAGTYVLEEVQAPENYRLPQELGKRTWNITLPGDSTNIDPSTLIYSISITNELAKYELPGTGSYGTELFEAGGIMLVGMAVLAEGCRVYRRKPKGRSREGENRKR